MRTRVVLEPLTLLAVAAMLWACGDSPSGPGAPGPPSPPADTSPGPLRRLILTPDSLDLPALAREARLTVAGADSAGRTVVVPTPSWASADTDIVVVDTSGRVTAVSPGATRVRVASGAVSAEAVVVVRPASDEAIACRAGSPEVVLVEEPVLARALGGSLARFAQDLCAAGYAVRRKPAVFADAPALRAYLADLRGRTGGALRGAILVGELPRAYQYVTLFMSNGQSESEEAISYQYYADLDGSFTASAGYRSPGGHAASFDQHTGNTDWEIWVGLLPPASGGRAATVAALTRYLDRNHAYRTGGSSIPRRFLEITEHYTAADTAEYRFYISLMRNGEYSWVPMSDAPDALLYINSPPTGMTVLQGLGRIAAGDADFTVHDAHGYWGASGQMTLSWVASNPVSTIVYWSNGCAVGDLDHQPNVLTEILYDVNGSVLIAKGTTNNSGGMGNNLNGYFGKNVATAITAGRSFGDAILEHVNVPLAAGWAASREFHFGTAVILGDPTLRLRP